MVLAARFLYETADILYKTQAAENSYKKMRTSYNIKDENRVIIYFCKIKKDSSEYEIWLHGI